MVFPWGRGDTREKLGLGLGLPLKGIKLSFMGVASTNFHLLKVLMASPPYVTRLQGIMVVVCTIQDACISFIGLQRYIFPRYDTYLDTRATMRYTIRYITMRDKTSYQQQEGILRAHASMWASEHKGNVLPWIVYIIVHYLWPNFSLRVKRILGFIRRIRS